MPPSESRRQIKGFEDGPSGCFFVGTPRRLGMLRALTEVGTPRRLGMLRIPRYGRAEVLRTLPAPRNEKNAYRKVNFPLRVFPFRGVPTLRVCCRGNI